MEYKEVTHKMKFTEWKLIKSTSIFRSACVSVTGIQRVPPATSVYKIVKRVGSKLTDPNRRTIGLLG